MKCPICGKAAGPRPANEFGPFCSDRCRIIDLGNWFGGEYRIPMEEPTEEDVEEAVRNAADQARAPGQADAGGAGSEPRAAPARRERGATRKPS